MGGGGLPLPLPSGGAAGAAARPTRQSWQWPLTRRRRTARAAATLPAVVLLVGAAAAAAVAVAAATAAAAAAATATTAADGDLPAPTVHSTIDRRGKWRVGWSGIAMPPARLAAAIAFPDALHLTLGRSVAAVVPVGAGNRRVRVVFRPANATLTVAVIASPPRPWRQPSRSGLPTDHVGRTDVVVEAATPAEAFGGHGAPSVVGTRLVFLAFPDTRGRGRRRRRRRVPGASTLLVGVRLPCKAGRNPRVAAWAAALAATAADNAALAVGGAPCDRPFRSITGVCNARGHGPWRGTAATPLKRRDPAVDGVWPGDDSMAFPRRPNCRRVSNAVAAQAVGESIPSAARLTDLWTWWGQFIDHDMTLTASSGGSATEEAAPIPLTDAADPLRTDGRAALAFARSIPVTHSAAAPGRGLSDGRPPAASGRREHANLATAFLDGSHIYGDEWERVEALRAHRGGRLRVGDGVGKAGGDGGGRRRGGCPGQAASGGGPEPMLPSNEANTLGGSVLPNEPSEASTFFAAGDRRANVQPALTALHTLFVREHNRVAGVLAQAFPRWDDERLYQEARQLVVATTQAITYNEWLPHALGPSPDEGGGGLEPYKGYNASVDPSMDSFFSTVAFRFGHSAVPETLGVLDAPGEPHELDGTPLADVYFTPDWTTRAGVGPILLGAASRVGQEVDRHVVHALRNALFAAQGGRSLDLVTLNCARGRDHGSPGINAARVMYGLPPHRSFDELTGGHDPRGAAALASVYRSVGDVDPFIGGLAEAHVGGGVLGGLFAASVREQFTALRDGDRFFYRNIRWGAVRRLPLGRAVAEGRRTLRDVLVDNGMMGSRDWPADVFQA